MTVQAKFAAFHAANPEVYNLYKRFAYELIQRGCARLSSKLIIERIRWETAVQTTGAGWNAAGKTKFLLDNRYTCWYSRQFIADFPNLADRFEIREIKTP